MSDDSDSIDPTLPEVVQSFLRSGAHLEEIRLDHLGRWTHEGLDFENPRVVRLFFRSVDRTEGGTWVLRIGQFTYPILVEDTGFFVEQVFWELDPPEILLSDETREVLHVDTLQYEPEGRLYCFIKNQAFRARFKRQAYHSIIDYLEEDDGEVFLVVGSHRKSLGPWA